MDGRPLPLSSPPSVPEMALLPFLRPLVAAARRHSGISPPLALLRQVFFFWRYMRFRTRNLSPLVKMMQKKRKSKSSIFCGDTNAVLFICSLFLRNRISSFVTWPPVPRDTDHRLRSLIGPEESFVKNCNANEGLCKDGCTFLTARSLQL